MDIQYLVKMANQIGQFFEAYPDREQAIKDIAIHLKRFWDPRMRRAILDYLKGGGRGLHAIVYEAITKHKDMLA